MNYPANTTRWRIGSVVIHDCDAKEPYMLMRVVGYQRDGLARCQYIHASHKTSKIWPNPISVLHDPSRFRMTAEWGNQSPARLNQIQRNWEWVRRFNHHHKLGTRVRTTSADGGFEAVTIEAAQVWPTGTAMIRLSVRGYWALEFVEVVTVTDDKSAHADLSEVS